MDFNSFFNIFLRGGPGFPRDPFREPNSENEKINRMFNDDDDLERFDHDMNMFQQMDDMLNKMFTTTFHVIGSPNFTEDFQNHQSPRNSMLKQPDPDPDQDISNSHSGYQNSEEFSLSPFKERKKLFEMPHFVSNSTFSSVKTVCLPDGRVEEHHTTVDSNGKKTTIVRRSIDGTSHEVITRSDEQGIKEKEENFMNMDENELPNFEQKWSAFRSKGSGEPSIPSISLPDTSPSYWHIIKKLLWL